jgi:hypothetical protein
MEKKTDNKAMKVTGGEYFTAQDMAKCLDVTTKVVNMRLFRLGIKPIAKDALYPASALDAIRDVTMGRPKKPETETKPNKSSTAKKPAKGKKEKTPPRK